MYEKHEKLLRQELQNVDHVALTSDLWTSRQTKGFLTVTAHFISSDWELKSVVITTVRVMKDHTSENIADELRNICDDWKITDKLCCIVTDNAANMVKAVKDILNVRHLGCFAHTLNLVVHNAIKNTSEVKEVQEKIKAIVSFFHHSVKASDKLRELQEHNNVERKKLIMDVATRWNSTFYMMERFQEQHEVVTTALCLLGRNNMCLNIDELKVVEKSVLALHPFEAATAEMSAEKFTSTSKIIPMVAALRTSIICTDDTERGDLYTSFPLGKELHVQLGKTFPVLENSFLLGAATLLDPRFKKVPFVNESNLKTVQERLLRSGRSEGGPQNPQAEVVSSHHPQEREKVRRLSLWKNFDEKVEKALRSVQPSVGPHVDMRRYLEEPMIPRDKDPLAWWKFHAPLFPTLQDQAKKFLCIPASSVPSERLFSSAGELVSQRRSCLSDKNVNMILFLNKNMN